MINRLKQLCDGECYGVLLYVLLTLAVCLQILIVVATVFSFIPIKLDTSLDHVLPQVVALFRPEREMAFYQFFVILTIAVQIAVMALFKNRLTDGKFLAALKEFLAVEYTWIGLLLFAAFKVLIYKEAVWAKALFYVVLALSLVSKVFWIEVKAAAVKLSAFFSVKSGEPALRVIGDILVVVLLILFLWVPDPNAALGRILATDRFDHWDMLLMSPALSHLKGAVLFGDAVSPFGAVAPVLVGRLAQMLGGFNYGHMLQALIILSLFYCTGSYGLLRAMFGRALAVFGVLLFVKLHFFHLSAAPLIWIFPDKTVLRSLFDLAFMYFLWRHAQSRAIGDLLVAAAACGWSIAWMPDTGLYQTLALYVYLVATVCLLPSEDKFFTFPADGRKIFGVVVLPWIAALGLLLIFTKGYLFSAGFWSNSREFMNGFWQGMGNMPVYSGLKARQFFALGMGLGLPVFFALSALSAGFGVRIKEVSTRNIWIVGVCAYGLAGHWYYINRSEPTLYYVQALPLVIVLCFWIDGIIRRWSVGSRTKVLAVLIVLALGGTLTNNDFIQYPNVFNLSGHDWAPEKKLFAAQMTGRGSEVIDRYIKPSDPAAVIAGFATDMLIHADRRPFFYYSPVLASTLPAENEFRGTSLYSKARLDRTLRQLEDQKPAFVFVEKKWFELSVPQQAVPYVQDWIKLKDYLDSHYEPADTGTDPVVLKRKL
jgi:hypothetical protein